MNTFRSGVADRGASIRIPLPVELKGYGYLEDRRPAANVDPYTVARLLIKVRSSYLRCHSSDLRCPLAGLPPVGVGAGLCVWVGRARQR